MDEIFRSKPERLVRLLPADQADPALWRADELADILRHQLAAPLPFHRPPPGGGGGAAAEGPAADLPHSFRDLLHHPSPPLELLRLAKRFAKAADGRRDDPIPAEIATVLYYAAVVAGLLRHGVPITSLDANAIQQGVDWVLARPWLDPDLRGLFDEWVARRDSGSWVNLWCRL